MNLSTLRCKGRIIDFLQPKVMGILNVTPDSFYDGGRYASRDAQLRRAEQLLRDGATWVDVGGMSSRPGADELDAEEEMARILPLIEALCKEFPEILISIDTYRAKVAEAAVQAGAAMVNDISAGVLDETMLPTVARLGVPYVMMHLKGRPRTMQHNPHYENVGLEVVQYFVQRVALARRYGIVDLVIDPGFGFGKSTDHNYTLLKQLPDFALFSLPLLVGVSRKRMVYGLLQTTPEKALNGTTILHTVALLNGANILRVHDVKEAMEVITLMDYYKNMSAK